MTKRTPQELADFFDCYATISPSGEVLLYGRKNEGEEGQKLALRIANHILKNK